jgi:hypothetical protein
LRFLVAFSDSFTSYISRETSIGAENLYAKQSSSLGPISVLGDESSVLVRFFCGREWAIDAIEHKEEEGGEKVLFVSLQVQSL